MEHCEVCGHDILDNNREYLNYGLEEATCEECLEHSNEWE